MFRPSWIPQANPAPHPPELWERGFPTADETAALFFPRNRRPSISEAISFEQVCVPCAVNRSGQSVAKVAETGKGSYAGLEAVLGGHIAENSIVCADGASVYNRLASERGLNRVMVGAYSSKKGCYSIQHINAYHGGLKRFVLDFNGVSTKHLNNYRSGSTSRRMPRRHTRRRCVCWCVTS